MSTPTRRCISLSHATNRDDVGWASARGYLGKQVITDDDRHDVREAIGRGLRRDPSPNYLQKSSKGN
jgi:hypothetical protein